MWTAQLLISLLTVASSLATEPGQERLVAVPARLAFVDGECRYWNTDVGLNSVQLQKHLDGRSDKTLRVEFWTDGSFPETCVVDGVTAAYRAGFRAILIRPKSDEDAVSDPPR
jgi:hypothetical protein